MPDRATRLAEFETAVYPPADLEVNVLCEDNRGTFVLPFLCTFSDAGWRNAATNGLIEARVVGWREGLIHNKRRRPL